MQRFLNRKGSDMHYEFDRYNANWWDEIWYSKICLWARKRLLLTKQIFPYD